MIKFKNRNIYLSASILFGNWMYLNKDISQLNELDIDFLHLDIIDGKFSSDFTMGSSIINKISNHTNLNFDYHLMVNEPSNIFETFNFKKSNIVSIHQESSRNLHKDIINLKKKVSKSVVH